MITEHPGLHPKWVATSNTEGRGHHEIFLRKSNILNTSDGTAQVVFLSPSGRSNEEIVMHNGKGMLSASIHNLFDNYWTTSSFNLMLNTIIRSEPKVGKTRSGDFVATVSVFENQRSVSHLTMFTILVDNLTPKLPNVYGLWNEDADSFSASNQREGVHNNPEKWVELAKFARENKIINTDFEATKDKIEKIDQNVIFFRNSILKNICGSLPCSSDGSPLMRGIYACSGTSISMDTKSGFSGKSIAIRSKADIEVNVNNVEHLVVDNHAPAQAVANELGANPAATYNAKLKKRIYDTTGPNWTNEVGSFELKVVDIAHDSGKSFSIGVFSESDGANVGRDEDDFSSCGFSAEGYFK